jgi:hypothetical protein
MTEREDGKAGAPSGPPGEGEGERAREAPPAEAEGGRKAGPTPEEAPELLGERSDYPIAWEPDESDR